MNLSELDKKKKRSFTAICTLGLSTVPISQLWGASDFSEMPSIKNRDAGWAIGLIFKLAFFSLILLPWMAISFIYHLFNYFYLCSQEKKMYH